MLLSLARSKATASSCAVIPKILCPLVRIPILSPFAQETGKTAKLSTNNKASSQLASEDTPIKRAECHSLKPLATRYTDIDSIWPNG